MMLMRRLWAHTTPPIIRRGLLQQHQRAALSSLARYAANGVLETDDYIKNGLPKNKYQLSDDVPYDVNDRASRLNHILRAHRVDPFDYVKADLRSVSDSILDVVGSDHPVLARLAAYFMDAKGKRIRPTVVILMSRACSALRRPSTPQNDDMDTTSTVLLQSQQRLGEIIEMIHTASLLHDDVIDEADTRRGVASINALFGNKLAILGGDFLLARASLAMGKLRNSDVTELMATIIEHLVKGEIMQMKPEAGTKLFSDIDVYLTKSFYKTGSLFANSCKAAGVLGNHNDETLDVCFEYGKNLGLAFQIVDDLLDFVGDFREVGKPVYNDLAQGIATLPVLYAADEFPQLRPMIARKFKRSGDIEMTLKLIGQSSALVRARAKAIECAESAVASVQTLPPSPAQSALIRLVDVVLNRSS